MIGKQQEGDYLETPGQMQMTAKGAASEQLAGLLSQTNFVEIHQKFDLLEAATQGMCEFSNKYRLFNDRNEEILSAREESSGCSRCCCHPYHSAVVYISDMGGTTLLTIERPGCEACCCNAKRCLGNGCPVCMDCCKDGIAVYDGKVEGTAGDLQSPPEPIFKLREAICGGDKCLWPKLYVHKGADETAEPVGKIVGPHCFGGCSELCMEATWVMSTAEENGKALADIVHLTPKSCEDICKEICSDTDKFRITYTSEAGQMDRTSALAASILVDYMFFEMDNGMISCANQKCTMTCCFLNCCGAQCPCKLVLAGKNGGGGGQE